jgi:hypothetical protein
MSCAAYKIKLLGLRDCFRAFVPEMEGLTLQPLIWGFFAHYYGVSITCVTDMWDHPAH